MATLASLRESVGSNLGGIYPFRPIVVDSETLSVPADETGDKRGSWAYYGGRAVRVLGETNGGLELRAPLSGVSAGNEVELWEFDWNPVSINGHINQAIIESQGRTYQTLPPIYRCILPQSREIPLADNVGMAQNLFRRARFLYRQFYGVTEWSSDDADFSYKQDSVDYRTSPSARIDIAAGATTPVIVSTPVNSPDYTGFNSLEGWFKASEDMVVRVRLMSGSDVRASVAVTLEAGEWEYIIASLPSQHTLDDIDAVELSIPSRPATVWTNGLWAVLDSSIDWERLPREYWRVDESERKIEVQPVFGDNLSVASVVRVQVGADPMRLVNDDDLTDVDSWYIIARATELAYSAISGGRETDPNNYRQQAVLWGERSREARGGFQPLVNIRRVIGGSRIVALLSGGRTPTEKFVDNDTIIGSGTESSPWHVAHPLPDVTATDNNSFLRVVSGVWAKVASLFASEVDVDATQFAGTGNLSSTDTDVQTALETIHGIDVSSGGLATVSTDATISGDGSTGDPLSLADGAVSTSKIEAAAVHTGKINDSAVTTDKIEDGAVHHAKIADNAVRPDNIQASAVTVAKMGSESAADGHVPTADGAGGVAWEAQSGGGGGGGADAERTSIYLDAADRVQNDMSTAARSAKR